MQSSCPVRARGLKCHDGVRLAARPVSCPVRARGLKYSPRAEYIGRIGVVPRAGTWIEIAHL